MKNIVILGSTGSIGTQCLDVVRSHPDRFRVVGLSSHQNIELLAEQIGEFRPAMASVWDKNLLDNLGRSTVDSGTKLVGGAEGLLELACLEGADVVVVATVGSVGLRPTCAAIRAGKNIALANKEVLVMAGSIIKAEAAASGSTLLPIDSEHSAIFQCLQCGRNREIAKICITASGGPFRNWSSRQLAEATVSDALRHPTWNMGKKITIDSAIMLNKGLEVIECRHLFDVQPEQIEVVIHPQSIVHSMVAFCDGSVMAHLGSPDMRIPIQYALTYPDRLPSPAEELDLLQVGELRFEAPDPERFRCLGLAYECCRKMGTAPTVLTVAGEVAVRAFLDERATLADIPTIIENTLRRHEFVEDPDLDTVLELEAWTKAKAEELIPGDRK